MLTDCGQLWHQPECSRDTKGYWWGGGMWAVAGEYVCTCISQMRPRRVQMPNILCAGDLPMAAALAGG